MFQITVKVPNLKFMREKYTEALKERLRVQVRQGAREFLRILIEHIPVDTGEARGTLFPLGRFLNVSVPTPGANPLKNKSAFTGAGGDKQLVFHFRSTKTQEVFEIEVQLFHFWFNEFLEHNYPNGQLPTPWMGIEAATEAFLIYMRETAPVRFPKITDFIVNTGYDSSGDIYRG